MNHKKLLIPALALSVVSSLNAAWQAEFNFGSPAERDRITDVINIEGSNARSVIEDGVLKVYPGDLFDSTSNVYTMLHLSTDLKAASMGTNGVVTVYFEFMQPFVVDHKALLDTVWGLSNIDPDVVLESNNRFNSYNMMARINSGNDNFEIRNGGGYDAVDLLQADVMYKMWIVIDYNLNFFEYYIQGGQWATQTRVESGVTGGFYSFRVNPATDQTVDYFLIALSAGTATAPKGRDPSVFDRVYVDLAGQNLTVPPPDGQTWAGFPVVEGWTDTGTFMGPLYVGSEPYSGWVYSSRMQDWIYLMEEWVDVNHGAWGYISNYY